MPSIWQILGLGSAHLVAQFTVLWLRSSIAMRRFDSPDPTAALAWGELVLEGVWTVLAFPLLGPLLEVWPSRFSEFPLRDGPFLLNSLVWGVALAFGWRGWKERRKKRAKASVSPYATPDDESPR